MSDQDIRYQFCPAISYCARQLQMPNAVHRRFRMGSPLVRPLTQPKCLCPAPSSAKSRTGPNQRHVWRFNLCAVSRFHSGRWETPPRSPWAKDSLSEPFSCDGFPAQWHQRPSSLFSWGDISRGKRMWKTQPANQIPMAFLIFPWCCFLSELRYISVLRKCGVLCYWVAHYAKTFAS